MHVETVSPCAGGAAPAVERVTSAKPRVGNRARALRPVLAGQSLALPVLRTWARLVGVPGRHGLIPAARAEKRRVRGVRGRTTLYHMRGLSRPAPSRPRLRSRQVERLRSGRLACPERSVHGRANAPACPQGTIDVCGAITIRGRTCPVPAAPAASAPAVAGAAPSQADWRHAPERSTAASPRANTTP